jgi:hypothetical protein
MTENQDDYSSIIALYFSNKGLTELPDVILWIFRT